MIRNVSLLKNSKNGYWIGLVTNKINSIRNAKLGKT